jgi:hypothetical protein
MANAFYWLPVFAEEDGYGPADIAAAREDNVAMVIQAFDVADLDAAANIINGALPNTDAFMSRERTLRSNQ